MIRTPRMCATAIALAVVLGSTGCASKLLVNVAHGLPLPTAVPHIEFYAHHVYSKGGKCTPVVKYRHVVLPGESDRHINVEPGPFATASLTVKYSERGTVSEVAFATEPSGDAANAATTAASTLLPFLGVVAKTQKEDVQTLGTDKENTDQPGSNLSSPPACDAGELPLALSPRTELSSGDSLFRKSVELHNELLDRLAGK